MKMEIINNKIKTNPEYQPDIEDYISSRFEPNKNINDLIALIQKIINVILNHKRHRQRIWIW